ncbi:Hsp33 family molecular chaperone HslO [Paenibacillus sp. FA6]|uniref:Hsp33 family molecular chaperone HslO n=1 Tax=Paenibacillus sp. FA6 TaxID=3413029 RepID=UPI003F657BC1
MDNRKDRLIRGTAMNGHVRAFVVRTTKLVEELRQRHDTWPTATAAMGRTLSAAAMMGAMLKGKEKINVQIKGDGPIGQIHAEANAVGDIRGYVTHPHVHLPSNSLGKLDVAGAVGRTGFVHVIKDQGLKDFYTGSSPIVSGEIAEDITYYFAISEQTPSAVGLGVLVGTDNAVMEAGGFIIQLMPGLSDDEITAIEQAVGAFPPITSLMDQGMELEEMLHRLLPDAEVLEEMDLRFQCQCSKERVEGTLVSLGQSELEELIEEDGKAEVVCHYCNEAFSFDKVELQQIMEQSAK